MSIPLRTILDQVAIASGTILLAQSSITGVEWKGDSIYWFHWDCIFRTSNVCNRVILTGIECDSECFTKQATPICLYFLCKPQSAPTYSSETRSLASLVTAAGQVHCKSLADNYQNRNDNQ